MMNSGALERFREPRSRREWSERLAVGAALGALAGATVDALGLWEAAGLPGLAGILFLAAAGLGAEWRSRRGLVLAPVAIVAAIYLAITLTPLMAQTGGRHVRHDTIVSPQAVVVLGSGILTDSTLSSESTSRLLTGLVLARSLDSVPLLTTRVISKTAGVRRTSDRGQRELVELAGLSARHVILDSVATTRHEAERTAAYLRPTGRTHVAVVTSPMHTRRACAMFEATGLTVTCVAARTRTHDTWHPRTPEDRLATFRAYLYEQLAMVKWRLTR
jgi:uncharacterized SAM-binding protein YcdF (DUF218 family)